MTLGCVIYKYSFFQFSPFCGYFTLRFKHLQIPLKILIKIYTQHFCYMSVIIINLFHFEVLSQGPASPMYSGYWVSFSG